MLQNEGNTSKKRHSYTQTGTGAHKIGVAIDIVETPKASKPTKAAAKSNKVKVGTPLSKVKPQPKYQIDIQAIQSNIDKIAMTEQMKQKGITPSELYHKTNPGLLGPLTDYTDPRQWYSSASSKKMMKKLSASDENRKIKSSSVHSSKENEAGHEKEVAFYVNFPNIPKKDNFVANDKLHSQRTELHQSTDNLPQLSNGQKPKHTETLIKEKTQVNIKHFTPSIEKPKQKRTINRRLYGSTESLDTRSKFKTDFHSTHHQSNLHLPRFNQAAEEQTQHYVETPPSALDRELTKSMEDILKSVTASDNVNRSLRQPNNVKLPQLKNAETETSSDLPTEDNSTSFSNWEAGVGMRKTYSYQTLNDYSQPIYRGSEDELSTRIMKASSNENLVQSRDKIRKLRLPQQKSTVEELTSFRNTYNLRQKSVLKLKLRPGFDPDKVPMNKVQVSKTGTSDEYEYEAIPSKIAQYIETKVPQRYIVVPDNKGEINPVQIPTDHGKQTTQEHTIVHSTKEPEQIEVPYPGTSFSHLPVDDSSEVHTLKTHRSEEDLQKKLSKEDQETQGQKTERSRSRSKSRNRSHSRSKSRERAKSEEEGKLRKGRLSRGSTISKLSKSDKKEKPTSRSVSREDKKRDGDKTGSEENRPQPSARSPSSNKVHLKPLSKHREPSIPPPSQKAYTKSYIPPKLKKLKNTYSDSLDTLIQQTGKTTRSVVVSLALKEKSVRQNRKNLVRAFDKYLMGKFADRMSIDGSEMSVDESERMESESSYNQLPQPPAEQGKRPVFRRMKTLVPFDERGRPITRGRNSPVINEDFPPPNREYKPSRRPPSYRLDLKQYPPNRTGPMIRDITFDKRNRSIVDHGLDRAMSFAELTFQVKKANSEASRSNNGSVLSNLTTTRTKHSKKHSNNHKRRRGAGEAAGKKGERLTDSEFEGSVKDSDGGSRYQADTPADSITASMMKEIYESLNEYLEEERDQGTQYDPDMRRKEILLEG